MSTKSVPKRRYPSNPAKPGTPLVERLWLYIEVDDESGCWLWTATITPNGYGQIKVDGITRHVHRVSYQLHVGEIPAGKQLDHLCRTRACCNPDHLEPVTGQVNVRRGESPGARALRRDRCLRGHLYAEHGAVRTGRRVCRLCAVTFNRLRRAMTPEEVQRRKAAGLPLVDLAAYFASQEPAA